MNSRKDQLDAFNRLLDIMDDLREKCPWDQKQTFESLRHLTIEETYELADAILENDLPEIKKELGDVDKVFVTGCLSERYKPDLVLIPIGGNFTMDPDDAAFALRTWVKPKMAIPMHYNSNPLTKGTFAEFQAAMKGSPIKIIQMTEGQTISF